MSLVEHTLASTAGEPSTLTSARQRWCKQALDLAVAGGALACLWPVCLAVALAIKLDSPGPVLFRQMRVGQHRRLFRMVKFRTMVVGTPELPTNQLPAGPAPVTRVGRFLRVTSLDELSQLFNVLRGDMSLVGPRPVLYNHHSILELRDRLGIRACRSDTPTQLAIARALSVLAGIPRDLRGPGTWSRGLACPF